MIDWRRLGLFLQGMACAYGGLVDPWWYVIAVGLFTAELLWMVSK